jgi:tRNA U38,U39,U40 pseudouridine synthase TruA
LEFPCLLDISAKQRMARLVLLDISVRQKTLSIQRRRSAWVELVMKLLMRLIRGPAPQMKNFGLIQEANKLMQGLKPYNGIHDFHNFRYSALVKILSKKGKCFSMLHKSKGFCRFFLKVC